jgi:D-alanyl-D-alanine carboxypeptidase/D-alanyl-D-alanine-endopeptidase (penicillin-binding protein 4)
LTLERFTDLLNDVRARGVREIAGDLVLDRTYFSVPTDGRGSFDNKPYQPYNTLPDALLLALKTVELRIIPRAGKRARAVEVAAEPRLPQLQLVNQLTPVTAPCKGRGIRPNVRVTGGDDTARITFSGRYPLGCGERSYLTSVLDHGQYVYGAFRAIWSKLGGSLDGRLREAKMPSAAHLIANAESQPLVEVVRDINKHSNNPMARQLFLTLGTHKTAPPATLGKADAVIRQWLRTNGMDFNGLVLENGSGLSRQERITATEMGGLLLHAHRSPAQAEFIDSLPIASVDGTMRRRLRNRPVAGHAHMKTGSLRGVKAIAGLVHNRAGRTFAVVFIANHPNAGASRAAQDELIEWVYEQTYQPVGLK